MQMHSAKPSFLSRSLRTAPYLSLAIGPIFTVFGIWQGLALDAFVETSTEAQVTVVQVDEKSGDNGPLYRPVFEVSDQGRQVKYAGSYWSDPPVHVAGDVADGRYDPASGEIMSLRLIESVRGFNALFRNIGIATFAIGAGLVWWWRRGA
jgi:hypothetical protein